MRKIPSLFRRDSRTGLCTEEVSPGCGWVLGAIPYGCEDILKGGIVATEKIDGTSCRISRDGARWRFWKRYDRKPRRGANVGSGGFLVKHAGPASSGWEACQMVPDPETGHWPGWLPVRAEAPEDRWHMEGLRTIARAYPDADEFLRMFDENPGKGFADAVVRALSGTYELIGPKVQGNPYGLREHQLRRHGTDVSAVPRLLTFEGIRQALTDEGIEGYVFYPYNVWAANLAAGGDLFPWVAKVKARDFGIDWKSEERWTRCRRWGHEGEPGADKCSVCGASPLPLEGRL